MARYVRDLVLNKPDDFVQFMMNDFLRKNSFVMSVAVDFNMVSLDG